MSFGDQLKKRREELGLRPRFVVDGAFLSQLVGRQRVVVVPVALDVVLRVADVAVFEDAFFLNPGETLLFSGRRGVGSFDADPPLQRIDLRQAAAAERVGQCESVDGVVLGIPGAVQSSEFVPPPTVLYWNCMTQIPSVLPAERF